MPSINKSTKTQYKLKLIINGIVETKNLVSRLLSSSVYPRFPFSSFKSNASANAGWEQTENERELEKRRERGGESKRETIKCEYNS